MRLFPKKIRPYIIGVGGRSCSGKGTVVKELEEKYKGDILYINQDKFFKVKADSWEVPASLRFDKLIEAIRLLKNGKKAFIPTHRWTEKFDREVQPHNIILLEGYLIFVNPELNQLIDKKIWVDVSDVNILYRRIKREGTSREIDYIMNVVIPKSKEYETMQRKNADIVIDGNKVKEDIIEDFEILLKKWHLSNRKVYIS